MLTVGPFLEEINHWCNANLVLNLLTCLQAPWLLVETTVRLVETKAVSELEITTCVYILCIVISYACRPRKPYSIEGRVTIRDKYIVSRDEYISSDCPSPPAVSTTFSYSTLQATDSTPSLIPIAHLGGAVTRVKEVEGG